MNLRLCPAQLIKEGKHKGRGKEPVTERLPAEATKSRPAQAAASGLALKAADAL